MCVHSPKTAYLELIWSSIGVERPLFVLGLFGSTYIQPVIKTDHEVQQAVMLYLHSRHAVYLTSYIAGGRW